MPFLIKFLLLFQLENFKTRHPWKIRWWIMLVWNKFDDASREISVQVSRLAKSHYVVMTTMRPIIMMVREMRMRACDRFNGGYENWLGKIWQRNYLPENQEDIVDCNGPESVASWIVSGSLLIVFSGGDDDIAKPSQSVVVWIMESLHGLFVQVGTKCGDNEDHLNTAVHGGMDTFGFFQFAHIQSYFLFTSSTWPYPLCHSDIAEKYC